MSASGLGSKAAASLGSILDYLGDRLQLFLLEAREARNGLLLRIGLFVIGGFFLLLAWLGVAIGLAGFLVVKAGWLWPWAAIAVGGAHLLVALLILLIASRKLSRPAFQESIREFQREREWLHSHRDNQNKR